MANLTHPLFDDKKSTRKDKQSMHDGKQSMHKHKQFMHTDSNFPEQGRHSRVPDFKCEIILLLQYNTHVLNFCSINLLLSANCSILWPTTCILGF